MAETLIPSCVRGIPSILSKSRARIRCTPATVKASVSGRSEKLGFLARSIALGRRRLRLLASALTSLEVEGEGSMSIHSLRLFFSLNIGKWNGSFYVSNPSLCLYPRVLNEKNKTFLVVIETMRCGTQQFDAHGNMLQSVSTKLSVSSYGEDDLISLIQSLYIKQPLSSTLIAGYNAETEWLEYKIKETNIFTVDKYQQIGFFPTEKAFSLRYQTAGMLETVLRAGVLGEDDTGEESPRNLKVPSRRPSIVCENCLYSLKKDMRVRVFHVMDPKGILEMLLIFVEQRGDAAPSISSLFSSVVPEKITPFLGKWKGHSITKRTGVYGATIAEAETVNLLDLHGNDQLIQDVTSTCSASGSETKVHWCGTLSGNLITFDGGFQVILLPGGMYMGCPVDIGKSVAELQSFHLEFCWMESPDTRQRLIRTYDKDGLAVSSTYILETKA